MGEQRSAGPAERLAGLEKRDEESARRSRKTAARGFALQWCSRFAGAPTTPPSAFGRLALGLGVSDADLGLGRFDLHGCERVLGVPQSPTQDIEQHVELAAATVSFGSHADDLPAQLDPLVLERRDLVVQVDDVTGLDLGLRLQVAELRDEVADPVARFRGHDEMPGPRLRVLRERGRVGAEPADPVMRERGTEPNELARPQRPEHVPLRTAGVPEDLRRPPQVEVLRESSDQEVVRLGSGILRQLREPLRGEDTTEAALATAVHHVDHRLSALGIAPSFGGEVVGLVDHDQPGTPLALRRREQALDEVPDKRALLCPLEVAEVDDCAAVDLEQAPGELLSDLGVGTDVPAGAYEHRVDVGSKRRPLPLGVDDQRRDLIAGLLRDEPQRVALAPATVRAQQHPGVGQLHRVELDQDLTRGSQDERLHAEGSVLASAAQTCTCWSR